MIRRRMYANLIRIGIGGVSFQRKFYCAAAILLTQPRPNVDIVYFGATHQSVDKRHFPCSQSNISFWASRTRTRLATFNNAQSGSFAVVQYNLRRPLVDVFGQKRLFPDLIRRFQRGGTIRTNKTLFAAQFETLKASISVVHSLTLSLTLTESFISSKNSSDCQRN